jgi:tetratricopeptide (TPR) repeat protein
MLHAQRLRALASHYGGEHAVAAEYAAALLYHDDQRVPLRLSGWLSRRLSMQIVMTRVFWMQGQGARAMALADECLRNAEDARFPAALSQALCLAALPVALWQGEDERARALLQQLEAHLAEHPQQYWTPWLNELRQVMALRALPRALEKRRAEAPDAKLLDHLVTFGAWGCHGQAMERWRQGMVGWNGPELLRIHGELLLREGAGEAAETAFMEALDLARKQQARAWALRIGNSLARMWLAQGRLDEARQLLAPWLARLDGIGGSADASEARLLLDRL